tara:strand:+ start:476 stop:682 length:207 start_codon:yes stop_codon:yes gene_type:complete
MYGGGGNCPDPPASAVAGLFYAQNFQTANYQYHKDATVDVSKHNNGHFLLTCTQQLIRTTVAYTVFVD